MSTVVRCLRVRNEDVYGVTGRRGFLGWRGPGPATLEAGRWLHHEGRGVVGHESELSPPPRNRTRRGR